MKRLYRSRDDAMFAGVCGGIAKYLGIDSTIVRIVTFLFIVPGGLSIWVYIALAIIIPLEPRENVIDESYGEKFSEPKTDSYEESYRNIYEEQKKKSDEDFY
ncbi:PspC domain-containing protein [Peptoniphilus sp. SGI.035]|uniref:PspC domain-containing protein n=1 Tax=Peptoniphilus sp. SGI.035 TaxID=3420564 RepID=UPI003D0430E3